MARSRRELSHFPLWILPAEDTLRMNRRPRRAFCRTTRRQLPQALLLRATVRADATKVAFFCRCRQVCVFGVSFIDAVSC